MSRTEGTREGAAAPEAEAGAPPAAEPHEGALALSTGGLLASAAAYAAVFVALAWPWLGALHDSLPRSYGTPFVFADDARFIVLVVGWIARALASDPGALYDLPIQHPAPSQLTGSEHFLASQVVAAPIVWTTGNALLAANAAALVSYPLAALAAQVLLVALGAGALAAWTGGLLFALGPLRVPASVQTLQYANLFLPLLAWSLLRLRERPERGRAVAVFAVAALGGLSSYHMAAMLGVVGALWCAIELVRPLPERARFLALACAAAATALLVLAIVSLPYFLRPEAHDRALLGTIGIREASPVRDTVLWFAILAPTLFGPLPLAIAGGGLLVLLARRARTAHRLAVAGALLVAVGGLLMLPPEPVRALIDGSPLRFLRAPWRFVAIAGLGTALLSTALLEWLRARLPARAFAAIALAAAVAVAAVHGRRLLANGLDPVPALAFDRALYEEVGRVVAARGPGPLLELPVADALGQGGRSDIPRALTDPDAMVGATLHHQPLVTGKTGYPPPHRRMIDQMIERLPSSEALQELVDATHLRWLLLRPEGYWSDLRTRDALLALPGVESVLERDGWVLARVERAPGRQRWYAAIAAPAPRERSPLGGALEPLAAERSAAVVDVEGVPAHVAPRALVPIRVAIANAGTTTWPVTAYVGTRYGVFLAAHWTPVAGGAEGAGGEVVGEVAGQALTLPRDVDAGESIAEPLLLKAPPVAGTYDLELRVKQWGGSTFAGAGNRPYRTRVVVAPASGEGAGEAAAPAEASGGL